MATRLYAPERTTDDLDILMMSDDAPTLYQDLSTAAGEKIGSFATGRTEWRLPNGTTLNVLESDAAWAGEAIRFPRLGPEGLPISAI